MHGFSDKLELLAAAVLLAALGAVGCKPEIGDDCQVSTDCSNIGDRLCDTTQPGGYCTIFNCEPGTCPEEAICIAFKTDISQSCPDPQGGVRYQRTFCMRSCEEEDDCRGGYDCIDMNNPNNPWGADVIESGNVDGRVCVVPHQGTTTGAGDAGMSAPPGVCTGTDAGFDVTFWEPDAGSTTTDAGSDATSDASAEAGEGGADASVDASVD